MFNRYYNSGLSLIEIIIVLALVAIISSLALTTYSSVMLESRRKDAQISLMTMQEELEIIRLEYGSLLKSETDKLPKTSNLDFYQLKFNQDKDSYILTAIPLGPQVDDLQCANFILNNLGQKNVSGTGSVSDCWD